VGSSHARSTGLLVLLLLTLLVFLHSHGYVLVPTADVVAAEPSNVAVSSAPQRSWRGPMIGHGDPSLRARPLLVQSLVLVQVQLGVLGRLLTAKSEVYRRYNLVVLSIVPLNCMKMVMLKMALFQLTYLIR
jgi:hypothetical protein